MSKAAARALLTRRRKPAAAVGPAAPPREEALPNAAPPIKMQAAAIAAGLPSKRAEAPSSPKAVGLDTPLTRPIRPRDATRRGRAPTPRRAPLTARRGGKA